MKNKFLQQIFKFREPNFDKLLEFGFSRQKESLVYQSFIVDQQFSVKVIVDRSGKVETEVVEVATGEPYALIFVETATGSFVGQVREEFENLLQKICDNCFEKVIFRSAQAKRLIEFVSKHFRDELEFLWPKFCNNAICRRKDTGKWYALFVALPKEKLGIKSKEIIDILNVRISPQEVASVVDNKRYFPAYHMNKKSWVTIILDDSVDFNEIVERVKQSFNLAIK